MKHFIHILFIVTLLFSSLSSCVRLNFDEDDSTVTPGSQVSLTTDWTQRGTGVDIPSRYFVMVNNQKLEYQATTNQLPDFASGTYPAWIYNQVDKVSVADEGIALAATTGDEVATIPGWFFSSYLDLSYNDKTESYTARMQQQVRQMNINVTIAGDGTQSAAGLNAKLEGIANTLDIKTNALSGQGLFIKPVFVKDGNTFRSEIRLMGVTDETKMFTLDITLADSSIRTLKTDLSSQLSNFNTDKPNPMTINVEYDLSTGTATINVNITDWNFH